MIRKKTFTNADLDVNYQLTYVHNLNTQDIIPSWKDENGIFRSIGDLFQIINDNTCVISCNEPVTGTQTLYLEYEGVGESTSGKRLFELTTTDNPNDQLRIALGKANTPASNILLVNLLSWLMTKLSFLKVSSNLSDLNNKAIARSNLSVYSTQQTDALLNSKAALYQTASGAVLGIANTSIYNPSSNYNPATLRNVKNIGHRSLLAGGVSSAGLWQATKFLNSDVLNSGSISSARQSLGVYRIAHNYGDLTKYMVAAVALGTHSAHIACINKQDNYFDVYIWDDDSLDDQDFEFEMYDFFTYTADE
jgi:hypothetical protein